MILASLLALLLGACGGESTDTTAGSTDTTESGGSVTTEPDSTPTTAGEGGDAAWEQIEEAAREEGELLVYISTFDSINANLIAAFNDAYPEITVDHVRIPSGEQLTRFTAERESGARTADVIRPGDNALPLTHPEWFLELSEDNIPLLGLVREGFVGSNYFGLQAGPFGWTYNTEIIDEPPVDICELADWPETHPELDGMVRLAIPGPGGGWGSWAIVREECGDDWLVQIGQMEQDGYLQYYDSSSTAVQEVGAGAAAMNAWGQPYHSTDIRDAGAPVDFAYIETPSWGLVHYAAINNEATNPNAALVFTNFLLTREGAEASCAPPEDPSGALRSLVYDDLEVCKPAPEGMHVEDVERGFAEGDEIDRLLAFEPEE